MRTRNQVGIGLSYRRPGYTAWRNWFLGIDSWAPLKFKNSGSELDDWVLSSGCPYYREPCGWIRVGGLSFVLRESIFPGNLETGEEVKIHIWSSYYVCPSNHNQFWSSVYFRLTLLQATKEDLEAEAEASRTRLQELLQERPLFSQLIAWISHWEIVPGQYQI